MAMTNCSEPNDKTNKITHTEPGVAVTCRTTSIIIGILCLFGGLSIGNTFRIEPTRGAPPFNWELTISVWVSSFLFCLILYAIGEIIHHLATSNTNEKIIIQQNEQIIQVLSDNNNNRQMPYGKSINTFDDLPDL